MTECTKNLSSTFFALANNSVAEGLGGRELTTFFDYVRSWFAELEGSKVRGYKPGRSIKSFLELALGQKIFDAKVYFFEKIPVALDITEVGFICLACVILSLLSAVPAACRALV